MANLTNIRPITNAVESTLYNLGYGLLKTFANEAATTRSFKITLFDSSKGSLWLLNGTTDTQLTVSGIQEIYVNRTGVTVVPQTGSNYAGQALKWKTPEFGNGRFENVFFVQASDSETASVNTESTRVGMTINAAAINHAPTLTTINTLTAKAVQNTAYSVSYATLAANANASDRDGDPVSFRIESISNGTLTINSSVSVTAGTTLVGAGDVLTWTPSSHGNATTAFTVKAWDGSLPSSSAIDVKVNVDRSNAPPTISIAGSLTSQSINDDSATPPLRLFYKDNNRVTLEDTDDGDNIKVTITLDNPAKGSLQIGSTGFTHNTGSYTYTGSPTAATTALQALTFKPTPGRVAVNSSETTTFKITVSDPTDPHLKSSNSTVSVVTTAANALPVVSDGTSLPATEDTPLYFKASDFISRYSDANGDRLNKIQITALPSSTDGTLKLGATDIINNQEIPASQLSLLNFVPATNYNSTSPITAFQWKASDGHTNGYSTTTASLKLTITPVNDAPTLTTISDITGGNESEPVILTYATLADKANEADVDGDTLSFRIEQVANGFLQRWTGSISTTGEWVSATTPLLLSPSASSSTTSTDPTIQLRWIPFTGKSGSLTAFSVKAWDGSLASDTAIPVKVSVTAVNHAPFGADKTVTLNEDASYTFQASDFGFYDPDGNSLSSISIESIPATGSLKQGSTVIAAGATVLANDISQLTYTPVGNANGTGYASFSFKVKDNGAGTLSSATANTLTFDVSAVNDAPTATITPTAYTYNAYSSSTSGLLLSGTGLSVSDIDAASNTVTVNLSVIAGTLTVSAGSNNGVNITNNSTDTITLSGPISLINAILAGQNGATLYYREPVTNPPASTTLTLSINDDGNTGLGGSQTSQDTASIAVIMSASAGVTVTIDQAGTAVYATAQNDTFIISPGEYTREINGFNSGDKLVFRADAILNVLPDSSDSDSAQSLTATDPLSGATTTINLTGLTATQDTGLFNVPSFATVFGENTIAYSAMTYITANGVTAATSGNDIFNIATGNYTYTINGFDVGDQLKFFANAILNIVNDSNQSDGIQQLTATHPATGAITTIILTGLTASQDEGLFNIPGFASVFGAGSIA